MCVAGAGSARSNCPGHRLRLPGVQQQRQQPQRQQPQQQGAHMCFAMQLVLQPAAHSKLI